jgi:transposase
MEASDFIADDWREWRRMRARRLKHQGWYRRDIAEALGVSEVSVSCWLARARQGGPEALLARPAPGRPPKLSSVQKSLIPEFLWHGAEAYGFHGEVWTCARIAKVIEDEFGVHYHEDHVGRLLKDLRWTPQVPVTRALQRNEEALRRWRDEVWPQLQQRARRARRVLVFEDESGSSLLPGVVRTDAPEGQTPVIRQKLTRDHLSVMGGMTPEGQVDTLARQESLNGRHSVEALTHLLRVASQRPMVIWDGSSIHLRAAVKEFVSGTRGRIWLEALPASAPDLYPWDEGGWHQLKYVEMADLVCRDLEELHEQFHLAVARLRQKPRLVRSCFAQAGLTLQRT